MRCRAGRPDESLCADSRSVAEFDDSVPIAEHSRIQPDFDASLGQLASGICAELFTKLRENDSSGMNQHDAQVSEVEEILSEQLATRVSVTLGKRKGKIVVEFSSREDLDRIVSEIVGSGPGMLPE